MSSNVLALVPAKLDRVAESQSSTKKSAVLPLPSRESNGAPKHSAAGPESHSTAKWVVAAVLAVAAVTGGWQSWKSRTSAADLANAHVVDGPRVVAVDRPTAGASSSIVLPATIRPWQVAPLHARVSGYLAAWHHDLGARVKVGELLAEIDTPELDQELAQNVALAREAVAAAAQARAERVEAEADLKVAEAQLVRVRAEVDLARAQFTRRVKLLEQKAISHEEQQTFQRDLAVRSADVAAAESDVTRRRTNLTTRAAIIQAREATAKSRQASVDRLKELQGFKRIVAPFDGVVTRRAAEVGMLVTANEDSLFTLEDMSRVRIQMNVPQTYAVQTSAGTAASISLPESSSPVVPGEISRVSDSVDSSSRTMLAEIELDNTKNHFQPGSYAQVTLKTQNNATWTIPSNTLQMRVDGPHVAVVNDRDEIEIRRVSLGRDLGTRVVAIEGIHGDERLVVNPGDELGGGVRVQVSQSGQPVRGIAQR